MSCLSIMTASVLTDSSKAVFHVCLFVEASRCFSVEFFKLFPVHRYSVDIFSYSGRSGILGSDGKQNTASVCASGA